MPESIPWWRDPSIKAALMLVGAPSLYQILVHLGVKVPLSQEHFTPLFVNGLLFAGCIVWVVRRVKRGNNPADPAPKVTLTSPQKP